jgi:hypothetical protein
MIGFLTRARRPSRPVPLRRARLALESLEGRVVPAAPTIASLSGRIIGSHVVITGQVIDQAPGAISVSLAGAVNASVATDSTGVFEYIGDSNGQPAVVTALAVDSEGLVSAPSGVTVAPNFGDQAPYLTMSFSYGSQRTITLEGMVYDENPSGIPVMISGAVPTQTVHADSQGRFTLTTVASSLGEVRGQATDFAGHNSNIVTVALTNIAPQVFELRVTCEGGNTYVLTGRVSDESPAGLTVTLGGEVDAFRGRTVVVGADGSFSLTVEITDVNDRGEITAQTTDWWGLTSNVATCLFA